MAKIDIDKFVASLIEYLQGENYLWKHLEYALKKQELKYKDGDIVSIEPEQDEQIKAGNWYVCNCEIINGNMTVAFHRDSVYFCPKDGCLDINGALFKVGTLCKAFRPATKEETPNATADGKPARVDKNGLHMCMYSNDNYTDEERKVLCEGCEEECELKQKSAEWSEQDETKLNDVIRLIENSGHVESIRKHYVDWLKSLRPQKQQQEDEWSDEDKEFLELTLSNLAELKDRYGEGYGKVGKCIDWLKSLQPQPIDVEAAIAYQDGYQKALVEFSQKHQEWTDDDINMIDWLIRCCEKEHEELCNDKYGHQDIVSDLKRDCRKKLDWLESLKDKAVPQEQWKPSKEQMDALNYVVNLMASSERPTENDLYYNILKSLRQQLKKLKA